MPTISVNNIQPVDNVTDLTISAGTNANAIVVSAGNGDIIFNTNTIIANSTAVSFVSNTLFINSTTISTTLTINSNTTIINANTITANTINANTITTANSISVGNTTTNAVINSTSISVSNSTSNLVITPTTSLGYRNILINGDMRIDQRNVGTAVPALVTTWFTVDRWCFISSPGTNKFNAQQNNGSVTPPNGFLNYVGLNTTTAYSVTATDYFILRQPIEGYNFAYLFYGTANAQPLTLSFWVCSSITGTHSGSLVNYAGTRSYPFSYTISSANTWTYIIITIPGDTSGTWVGNTNAGAANLNFNLGSGTSQSGTAGTWASAYYTGVSGAVSVVGTLSATFYVTGVQLELGSIATPFEYNTFSHELLKCQRYIEKSYDLSEIPGATTQTNILQYGSSRGTSIAPSLLVDYWSMPYLVSKRAVPTFTIYSPVTGASGKIRDNSNDVDVTPGYAGGDQNAYRINATLGTVQTATNWTWHFRAGAEL